MTGKTGFPRRPLQAGVYMSRDKFSLDDKYLKKEGQIALTGVQALVRLPMDQHRRDTEAGIRTGTFVSGYQGSPLGELDKQMRLAAKHLGNHEIVFDAGINEDVAATAIYGTQFLDLFPHEKFDGVLGMWYGKGPGIDRTGDAFRHGNYIGTSKHGAALALGGDDPACKSSTIPSDSVVSFYDVHFPVLFPSDPQEVLEYGLHGFAMSRYSGLWSALKIVTNVADGGAIIDVYPDQAMPVIPDLELNGKPYEKVQDFRLIPPHSVEIERMIIYERMAAAKAYARANNLDKITVQSGADKIGLLAAGKTYVDMMQALQLLGFGEEDLRQAGIRIYKLGMIAPIEPEGLKAFAEGLEEILVVEEKRGFSEVLVRDALFNLPTHPAVYGKYDADNQPLFPAQSEMQADMIAMVLADYLAKRLQRQDLLQRVKWLVEIEERPMDDILPRMPYFCSGCPHNSSTLLPEGEITGGGIGCHAMASYMDRGVIWLTHMGGEGAPWMGVSHFVDREHLFQNVGDGTFAHSASKSVEACVASGVNITYKLLYNGTVAMTGGQTAVGARGPANIAHQLIAQGVKQVVIVPEQMDDYPKKRLAPDISVRPKDDYNQVMLEMREVKGVSVIIYDQQCAAVKRRERKRGIQPVPRKRVYINPAVCEGCGDCGIKSNCLSVVPMQTDYGRKTMIHQSSCNMDYSCLKGDCPSFMTVELGEGVQPAKKQGVATEMELDIPEPAQQATCADPYRILMVGIGGTGVVTADALLVTAALLDGKYALHLDQTGLAQKGGAVVSNLTICESPVAWANKISAGETDLLLSFDLLASVARENLNRCHPERTVAVANTAKFNTAQEVTNIRAMFPEQQALAEKINQYTRRDRNVIINSEQVVEELFGDPMTNNVFMMGAAYQAGLIPLRAESIEEAIQVNGVAVDQNIRAFRWGRKFIHSPDEVNALIRRGPETPHARQAALDKLKNFAPSAMAGFEALEARFPKGEALADILHPRVADLILYQNTAYAGTYLDFVSEVAEKEHWQTPGRSELAETTARWLFKLMAYKDEYEVARLWLQDPAWAQAAAAFDGPVKRYYQLHPPVLRAMGMKKKLKLGGWFTPMLRMLARMKFLRGSALDIFGRAAMRREERGLIGWYRELVTGLLPGLNHDNHGVALEIAAVPDGIRGFEEVKERMIAESKAEAARLLDIYNRKDASKQAV
ncbi:MAG: indolepyruvate ferredoxin oxidoreductase family protein [SAR324 cluster bacterium]|nr:indolepyruvate ferredoxin oxidoreductase family protein [SAR324 cluster bacterium]